MCRRPSGTSGGHGSVYGASARGRISIGRLRKELVLARDPT
jgi:hypothetical protein